MAGATRTLQVKGAGISEISKLRGAIDPSNSSRDAHRDAVLEFLGLTNR